MNGDVAAVTALQPVQPYRIAIIMDFPDLDMVPPSDAETVYDFANNVVDGIHLLGRLAHDWIDELWLGYELAEGESASRIVDHLLYAARRGQSCRVRKIRVETDNEAAASYIRDKLTDSNLGDHAYCVLLRARQQTPITPDPYVDYPDDTEILAS